MAFNRIVINEQDLTTVGEATGNENVVFIPGLSGCNDKTNSANWPGAERADHTTLANFINTPILCTTIDEFEYKFGKYPHVFVDTDVSGLKASNAGTIDYTADTVFYQYALDDGQTKLYPSSEISEVVTGTAVQKNFPLTNIDDCVVKVVVGTTEIPYGE